MRPPLRLAVMSPLLLLSVPLLVSCGGSQQSEDSGAAASSSSAASAPPGGDSLAVEVDRGQGGEPERYSLSCTGTAAGDLPDAAAVCAHLQVLDDPFAAVPDDETCTQQFGGPQTARVTGRWADAPVDLQLSRADGCRIAQWDELGPLLPGPVG
jgi:hypothetical protein